MRRSLLVVCPPLVAGLFVLAGCGDDASPQTAGTPSSTSAGTTEVGTSSSSSGFASTSSSGVGSESSSESTGDPPDPTTGPPPPPKLCSLEAVDPSADPSVVEMGDEAGLLPTVIGEALLRNCGCHYSDRPDVFVDYMSDVVQINTWADFHIPFAGIFPMGYEDRMVWEATQVRVVEQLPVPMPAIECDVEGEPGVITEADKALFEAWFDAGAPDGASFSYP